MAFYTPPAYHLPTAIHINLLLVLTWEWVHANGAIFSWGRLGKQIGLVILRLVPQFQHKGVQLGQRLFLLRLLFCFFGFGCSFGRRLLPLWFVWHFFVYSCSVPCQQEVRLLSFFRALLGYEPKFADDATVIGTLARGTPSRPTVRLYLADKLTLCILLEALECRFQFELPRSLSRAFSHFLRNTADHARAANCQCSPQPMGPPMD